MLVLFVDRVIQRNQQVTQTLEHVHAALVLSTCPMQEKQVLRVHEEVAVFHVLRMTMLLAPSLATPRLDISTVAAPAATAVVALVRMTLYSNRTPC